MNKFVNFGDFLINRNEIESMKFESELTDSETHFELALIFTMKSGGILKTPAIVIHENRVIDYCESVRNKLNETEEK